MRTSDGELEPTVLRMVASLDDSSRRDLYLYVRAAPGPVTREQAAAAVGLSRKMATFHLDRLVDAGLLVIDDDPAIRHRPLGRPPKGYRPAPVDLRVSIPDRRPVQLAEILLDAIATARPWESSRVAALRTAEEAGRRLAAASAPHRGRQRVSQDRTWGAVEALLTRHGYEPIRSPGECLRLRNCPFRPLAAHAPDLVCAINHRFIGGLLDALRADSLRAELEPGAGGCCVVITSAPDA